MVRDTKLYNTLGVSPDASDDEIKRAYRKLAMKWHPDRNTGANKDKAEAKFKEIQHAHGILSDEKKRRIYDQVGEEGLQGGMPEGAEGTPFSFGGGGPGGGTFVFTTGGPGGSTTSNVPPEVLEQLFSSFGGGFGGLGGSGRRRRGQQAQGGDDDDMDMDGGFGGMGGMGGLFGSMFGGMGGMPGMMGGMGGMPGMMGGMGRQQQRTTGGKRRRGAQAGPFAIGGLVQVHGLTGSTELNGKKGTVTGMGDGGRVTVDFGSSEKSLKPANLRAVDPEAYAQGAAVVAEGLTGASHLNGCTGHVVGTAAGGRVEVLFNRHGAKALLPANLRPAA